MKKLIVLFTLALGLMSCAHHHAETAHHHDNKQACCSEKEMDGKHMFDKKCALSVAEGDIHTDGKDEFQLSHAGKIYYFSTEKKMETFKEDLTANSRAALNNWRRLNGR